MSETPRGPAWWQAADGRWYPPELHPANRPAPPPPPPLVPGDFHPGAAPRRPTRSTVVVTAAGGPTAAAPWAAGPAAPPPPGIPTTPPVGMPAADLRPPLWARPLTWVAVATIVVASVLGVVLGLLASSSA